MRICPKCKSRLSDPLCPFDGAATVPEASAPASAGLRDPMIGRVIGGKYRIEEKLGGGGFGAVFRGIHGGTGGRVAIKLLVADLEDDANAAKRFYIEARNTHKLNHHNTVRVSDFGRTEDGVLYLVMELLDGRSLDKVLKEEVRLPAERAVHIIEQVLKSLAEAHGHNIVHRDIKPANIMLVDRAGEPDFVKVLDFGVSRALDGPGADTRGSIGTPRYMSPEQCRGVKVDHRADLYSVGCLLYRMLAGRTPFTFERGRGQALAYIHAHVAEPPPPLLQTAANACSRPLAELTMSLLAKNPADRPASALAVLDTLRKIRQGPGLLGAGPPPALPAVFSTGTTGDISDEDAGGPTRAWGEVHMQVERPRRAPVLLWVGLGAFALAALAVLAIWLMGG